MYVSGTSTVARRDEPNDLSSLISLTELSPAHLNSLSQLNITFTTIDAYEQSLTQNNLQPVLAFFKSKTSLALNSFANAEHYLLINYVFLFRLEQKTKDEKLPPFERSLYKYQLEKIRKETKGEEKT
jgi:hypothetical protein